MSPKVEKAKLPIPREIFIEEKPEEEPPEELPQETPVEQPQEAHVEASAETPAQKILESADQPVPDVPFKKSCSFHFDSDLYFFFHLCCLFIAMFCGYQAPRPKIKHSVMNDLIASTPE